MPLIENTNRIYKKYDTRSYSPSCNTYFQANEETIVCIIINEKERQEANLKADKIATKVFNKKKVPSCVRGSYVGNSLTEFDKFLSKYFKLKK